MDDTPGEMPDHDANDDPRDDNSQDGASQPPPGTVHGSFRVDHRTARLPKSIGGGEFANAIMVAAGPLEFILDFVQRLGEPARVVARVVMPPVVVGQFLQALQHNVGLYESQFGPMPSLPKPPTQQAASDADAAPDDAVNLQPPVGGAVGSGIAGAGIAGAGIEPQQPMGQQRPIEDIYDELKLDDDLLAGRYANAVVVRHSPAEFAFEFIARFMPASVVSNRVIVSAPNVPSLIASLRQAVGDHQRRQTPPGRGDVPPSVN